MLSPVFMTIPLSGQNTGCGEDPFLVQVHYQQPSRRDRNRYNFADLLRSQPADPKYPKEPHYFDFQFFDVEALKRFHQKVSLHNPPVSLPRETPTWICMPTHGMCMTTCPWG